MVYALILAFVVAMSPAASAQDVTASHFNVLLERLPAAEAARAELVHDTGEDLTVLRKGNGRFQCVAWTTGGGTLSLTCMHRSLVPFLAHQRALSRQGLRNPVYLQQLCADVASGAVTVPEKAYMIGTSLSRDAEGGLPDASKVYHFLQLPYATEAGVGLRGEELVEHEPWLHHGGTCDAHVMWSEIAEIRFGSR